MRWWWWWWYWLRWWWWWWWWYWLRWAVWGKLLYRYRNKTYIYIYIYIYIYLFMNKSAVLPPRPIGIMVWVFTNGLKDQDSVPGQVILKLKKMVLDTSMLNSQHYKVWIKSEWSNPWKGVVPSLTTQCSSYWKGSFWVTLNSGWPNYLLYTYIYTYWTSNTYINAYIYKCIFKYLIEICGRLYKSNTFKKKVFFSLCTTILLRILSLPLSYFLFFVSFPLRHYIIVNVFDEKGYAETPLPPLLSLFLSPQLIKIISTFKQSKISNQTLYIWL